MRFDDVVHRIGTLQDVRRIARAHVVDHTQLKDEELRDGLIKVKPQYLDRGSVEDRFDNAVYGHVDKDYRVLSRAVLVDVLLDQYDFSLPYGETEERVIEFEQAIVNRSNEVDLADLAPNGAGTERHRQIDLYNYVLDVAWERHDTVSPDEANLLRRLRTRLRVNEWDHRVLEAKLSKYPKPGNALHTRSEIGAVRRYLQAEGLLFTVRDDEQGDRDVIPQELAGVLREIIGIELRTESYRAMLAQRPLRKKSHLQTVLQQTDVEWGKHDTLDALIERVVRNVRPSCAIASASPRFGLNRDELRDWCRELGVSPYGSMEECVERVVDHFDQLRPPASIDVDERSRWYEFYVELACRDRDTLRAQHVIDKDLEIESKFEQATSYLFAELLNHKPLHQPGSNHPDGLLSLGSLYLMWDNKSKETPVQLKEHTAQFHGYMEGADKQVPLFMVIGPEFTNACQADAVRYHAEHLQRNILLITAAELKGIAEEWSAARNKNREEPFPLGLLATTGRFDRESIGKLY